MTTPQEAEDGLRRLYASTSRRVYAYARRHADADLAEQIVADTYVAAWRHFDSLPDEPLPWLITTAHNHLRTHWRGEQRRRRLAQSVAFATRDESEPGPEGEVIGRHAMLAAIDRLSPDDREALLLVAWDGLSYVDAAAVLGISRNTFASRLMRARERLTDLLDTDLLDTDRAPAAHRAAPCAKGMTP